MAVCARAMNKPFYVLAESFKFVRVFPLNQLDIPSQFQVSVQILLVTMFLNNISLVWCQCPLCCIAEYIIRYPTYN